MLVLLLGLAVPARAEGPPPHFKLYDDFSRRLLDPARWLSWSRCGAASLECTREIREDALALRVRAYGQLGSDQGRQFGSSALALTDISATAISVRLQVRAASAAGCPTNLGEGAHGQALIAGAFFNSGDGSDAADDVIAYLQLDRFSSDPQGKLRVESFWSSPGGFVGNFELATVDVREEVVVQLIWDQPNHRFLARLFRQNGAKFEAEMPYSPALDAAQPAVPQKSIQANAFAPNCQSGPRPFAEMDVRVRSVFTGTP